LFIKAFSFVSVPCRNVLNGLYGLCFCRDIGIEGLMRLDIDVGGAVERIPYHGHSGPMVISNGRTVFEESGKFGFIGKYIQPDAGNDA
jgi:hypothetical protein